MKFVEFKEKIDKEYCQSCKAQIEQETAQKIFEEIEKLFDYGSRGHKIMTYSEFLELKSKYGVK